MVLCGVVGVMWCKKGDLKKGCSTVVTCPFRPNLNQQESLNSPLIHHRFVLDITQRKRWKLYKNNAHKISQVSWRYPYLDISFYRQNASHVWDRDVNNFYMFIYPKHWIFPLTSRPFQGRWLPAPRDVKNTLNLTYNLNMCQTGGYSHQKETLNKKLYYLPCKELHGVVPFVERVEFVGGCRETLVLGDKALGHHFLQDTNC